MGQEFKNIDELEKELERIQKSTKTLFKFTSPLHDILRMKYQWYYNWHTFKFAKAIHLSILILFLFSTFLSSYLYLSSLKSTFTYASAYTWGGGGDTNNFSEAANWVGGVVPGENAQVTFDSTSTKDATVDASFTSTLASLTIAAGYTGTITASTLLQVSGDLSIADGTLAGTVDVGANLNVVGGDLASNTSLKTFYDIALTIGEGGTINGLAVGTHTTKASKGRNKAYTINANEGYQIQELQIDSQAIPEAANQTTYTHTFENITANHTLQVSFQGVVPEGGSGLDDEYTQILMHFDGEEGSQIFTDESGREWSTRVGNPIIGANGIKFGTGAVNLPAGESSAEIITPYTEEMNIGTSDVTLDFWMAPSIGTPSPYRALFGMFTNYNAPYAAFWAGSTSLTFAYDMGGTWGAVVDWSGISFPESACHVAIMRHSGVWHATINGVELGGKSVPAGSENVNLTLSTDTVRIIASNPIDELRFSPGIARWKHFPFAPPTQSYGSGYNGMPPQVTFNLNQTGFGSISPSPISGTYLWEKGYNITFNFSSVVGSPAPAVTIDGVSQGNISSYTFESPQADNYNINITFSGSPPSVQISGADIYPNANGTYVFESESRAGEDEYGIYGSQTYRKDETWKIIANFYYDKQSQQVSYDMADVYEGSTGRYNGVSLFGTDNFADWDTWTDTASGTQL